MIKRLISADKKFWLITGDKKDTAISVGKLSGIVQNTSNLAEINKLNFREILK